MKPLTKRDRITKKLCHVRLMLARKAKKKRLTAFDWEVVNQYKLMENMLVKRRNALPRTPHWNNQKPKGNGKFEYYTRLCRQCNEYFKTKVRHPLHCGNCILDKYRKEIEKRYILRGA